MTRKAMNKPRLKKNCFGLECKQDWNDLEPAASGRFCKHCQKNVVDFRQSSRSAILAHYQKAPDTCGFLYLEQLEPSLRPLQRFLYQPLVLLFSLLSWAGVQNLIAQNPQSPPGTEQQPYTRDSITDKACYLLTPVSIESNEALGDQNSSQPASSKTIKKKNKYFLSWRFPFIHKRKTRRFMGCPKF